MLKNNLSKQSKLYIIKTLFWSKSVILDIPHKKFKNHQLPGLKNHCYNKKLGKVTQMFSRF